ncbi:MAG: class II fructose-bisphosphate aldolase [Actinobacteria bacterium]|nr:class II fructose-bisphosphate aldolase [Actinomycetota bacterium]
MAKFVKCTELYEDASKKKYAVGAFNVSNSYIMQGLVNAVKMQRSPVVMSVSENFFDDIGDMEAFIVYLNYSIRELEVPIALHLDHGGIQSSFENIMKAVSLGFKSVMFDCSNLQFTENIKQTKRVVEACHAASVDVEAALGEMPFGEMGDLGQYNDPEMANIDFTKLYTDPEEAAQFVSETGVDALAISVGTVHGLPKNINTKIDYDRINKIKERIDAYLVVHGGSGLSPEDISRMIDAGIVKFNVGSDIYKAICNTLIKQLNENNGLLYRFQMQIPTEEVISRYMTYFRSAGWPKNEDICLAK